MVGWNENENASVNPVSFNVSFSQADNASKNKSGDDNTSDTLTIEIPPADTGLIDTQHTTPEIAQPDNTTTEKVEEPKKTEVSTKQTTMMRGTMMVKAGSWIIRADESGEMKDYFPTNLSDEFKEEGLTVGFQGILQEIPKNVRMVGAPIELTSIKRMTIKN